MADNYTPKFFTTSQGGTYNQFTVPPVNVSLDNLRRTFDLSGEIAELRPQESPFFSYLTRLRKMSTPDPVFKMMEQRHQWQRRNFFISTAVATLDTVKVSCKYDRRGKTTTDKQTPIYFVPGQIVAIENATNNGKTGTLYARVNTVTSSKSSDKYAEIKLDGLFLLTPTSKEAISGTTTIPLNARGQIIGTAYPEGSGVPDSWYDLLGQTEGYTQIFKTACPLMSGSAMATEYRGKKNEFMRIWDEKLREHKMDIEHAALFGVGNVATSNGILDTEASNAVKRYTWGILPFVSLFGNVATFSYSNSGYNSFVDWSRDMFAPENGNSGSKLVLASRKLVAWFNKLGSGTFLGNTLTAGSTQLDVQNIKSQFGFNITRVSCVFGDFNFVSHPLLREQWENYCIVIDLGQVAYRPLVGNGISRDTFYQTNVQSPDVDGRIDQIITEAGIQITLPETHAVLKWNA